MSIGVSKSLPVVVVGPCAGIVHLSSFDRCIAPIPVTLLLVFDQPIDGPVETIKKALSRALAHYPPMAGRLAATGDDGELHIACTGEGVSFVGAAVSCALDDDEVTTPALLLGDLAVGYPAEYCGLSDAFLLMQVTEFSCGGFVVGMTWNHVMADAAGMAQFLQAVGELARGMPAPAVVPVTEFSCGGFVVGMTWNHVMADAAGMAQCRRAVGEPARGVPAPPVVPVRSEIDGSLPRLPPAMVAAVRSQMRMETEELASLDVTIPSSLVGRIKAECAGDCTVFEAVAAVLWRCRTRAVISDSDADTDDPAPLAFPSNVRGLVGAKEGYYGNCVTMHQVQATSGAVASGDIKDLVKLIKLAKEKASDIFRSSRDAVSGGESETDAGSSGEQPQLAPPCSRYNTLSVTSWRNLGFEAVDFGRGTPARVMWKAHQTVGFICVVCPPCKGEDGVNVVSLCVKPEHADAFVAELAALNI
uniref:3'-N-debenzoyl-2'-deoxytaxol N-benzoyltransferase n=1 Tax=Aegilops tauschii TaxID=37682 RepID=M8CXE1_AEGTA